MFLTKQEEALLVVDDFTARARDLQEGPGMPADDVDYVSAKVYAQADSLFERELLGGQ